MKIETFGLPASLQIPIAASSVEVLESAVGEVIATKTSRSGRVNALLIKARPPLDEIQNVPLWNHQDAEVYRARLHPELQVWVHVDYHAYRKAWREFGMPAVGSDFLDHIRNRRAIRLRRSAHPYLRLCPVSPQVNTSGGSAYGGEGMEHDFATNIESYTPEIQEAFWAANNVPMVMADPMDLTKMLNIPPRTKTLDGVRDTQHLFYPKNGGNPPSTDN